MGHPKDLTMFLGFQKKLYASTGCFFSSLALVYGSIDPRSSDHRIDPEKWLKNSLSGSLAVTSNYVDRGLTQTCNIPAFQGELDWTFVKSGIYGQIWGSNVRFTGNTLNDTATVEADMAGGIRRHIGENFTWDLSLIRYTYPKTLNQNYNEFIAFMQYFFFTAWMGYSEDVYSLGSPGAYYNLGIDYDIPEHVFHIDNLNLTAGVGYYDMPESVGLKSYEDYSIKLTKSIHTFDFSIQWTSTTGRPFSDPALYDSKIIGTLTANF